MWKIVIYFIVILWCIISFPKAWKEYKNERSKVNLMELLARMLIVPAGIVLIVAELMS